MILFLPRIQHEHSQSYYCFDLLRQYLMQKRYNLEIIDLSLLDFLDPLDIIF
jgi:hypothetical protein